ncbi:enediyne biosynthesis protein [Micromonospora sp. NPDC051296]|uniref:enediyne biosynthesis protein n=1 Tax=Micromonospora sp. NPDC051296 TaxID=3155046 RepID=UPI003447D940
MTQQPMQKDPRIVTALRRFAISITVLNVFGYTVLGFEQAWAWPLIAVAVGYGVEILLETIGARAEERRPRYLGGGVRGFVEFLYPAHITSLAVNMLLYVNDRLPVMLFAVAIAISGKWLLRAPVNGRLRHFMNPSNFGIAIVLLLFPWISIAPPYQFTENLTGIGDWIVPAAIVVLGTMLNAKLTGRMWLIAGWLGVFVLQSVFRGLVLDTSIPSALATMTGVAFVLFTNYMITDPGTTPSKPLSQFAFGGGVALVYGVLTGASIVYGLFFATAIVCLIRGGFLWSLHAVRLANRPDPAGTGALDGKVSSTVAREMVRT